LVPIADPIAPGARPGVALLCIIVPPIVPISPIPSPLFTSFGVEADLAGAERVPLADEIDEVGEELSVPEFPDKVFEC